MDIGLLTLVQVGAFLGAQALLDRDLEVTADLLESSDASRLFLEGVVAAAIVVAFPFAYRVLFERFWHGQTVGKFCFGLRVERSDGTRPRLGCLALREGVRIPCALLLGLGHVVALTNRRQRTLYDLAAGTVVAGVEWAGPSRRIRP